MNTKEKILSTALELYNEQGVSAITSRHIAAELGISAGNLHYHFKQTDDIIIMLFDELSERMNAVVERLSATGISSMNDMRTFVDDAFELIYKYRFIFLHAVEISLRIPSLRKAYQLLMKRRTEEFMSIFKQLVKKGVFRSDIPEKIWKALITQVFIVIDFWLSNNELNNHFKGRKAIAHYSEVYLSIFYPYLTSKALAAFELK